MLGSQLVDRIPTLCGTSLLITSNSRLSNLTPRFQPIGAAAPGCASLTPKIMTPARHLVCALKGIQPVSARVVG